MKDLKRENSQRKTRKTLIKKCYHCESVSECFVELKRCPSCDKSFLPLNYVAKDHEISEEEFWELYRDCDDIDEEELVRGIYVLWDHDPDILP